MHAQGWVGVRRRKSMCECESSEGGNEKKIAYTLSIFTRSSLRHSRSAWKSRLLGLVQSNTITLG